ncbi:GNAT family N-acetyltransferase [Flavobacteriaceae bacterium KMM 6898]|nr:GNAT family N-acetyltransferase [Flavobacteriaceae bacterium KMM 6898]
MKTIEKQRFYKIKMVRNRIKNGLFLFTLRNFLTRIGLDIDPYYWDEERLDQCTEPKIRDTSNTYEIVNVEADEVGILHNILGMDSVELKKDIQNGQLCMGLKHKDEIVAVVFAKFNDLVYKNRTFKLGSNQGYILNLYTFESYRGKNLAPYLRYHCYLALKERGVDNIFCITSYFNKSVLISNKKLNIKHVTLFLHIGLFKRFHWNYILKNYK